MNCHFEIAITLNISMTNSSSLESSVVVAGFMLLVLDDEDDDRLDHGGLFKAKLPI